MRRRDRLPDATRGVETGITVFRGDRVTGCRAAPSLGGETMTIAKQIKLAGLTSLLVLAAAGASAQTLTLPDVQALLPQYGNVAQQNPSAFQTPCVDASGTMTIVANVGDITMDAIAVAMVCQAVGYPPYMAGGTVTFDVPGAFVINHSTVPGFPDAFLLEFGIPSGTAVITITITDTGWPEGCIDPGIFLDFAGFDDLAVPTDDLSWGRVKAIY